MKSIRIYLVVVLLSVICLTNFIAALHGYRSSLRAADQLVDQQLLEKAASLASLANNSLGPPDDLFDSNMLFQIWRNGTLAAASQNAPTERFVEAAPGYHFVSYAGIRWRTWIEQTQGGLVIAAQRFDGYAKLVESILLQAILPIIWVLPVLAVLVWLVVSFGLQPLSRLAAKLNSKKADDLTVLDSRQYPAEMTVIVNSLNQMFNRLGQAFERERRFSADAAHELRTPLSALKVGLHNLSLTSASDPNLAKLKDSVNRMGHSIEQILALHRISVEKLPASQERCELTAIAQNVISEIYAQIELKEQFIELEGKPVWIDGDRFSLSMLLRNLIDNAGKYTPEKGRIRVTIDTKSKDDSNAKVASILVEDSGPGIPEAEYSRVVERFYRVGGDRHPADIVGSGLGLAIVAFVVQLHQGNIYFSQSAELGGLAVEIIFPGASGGDG